MASVSDEPEVLSSHHPDCPVNNPPRPPMYWVLTHPDGDQHCESCHCICDPEGPTCGHYAGCPGC